MERISIKFKALGFVVLFALVSGLSAAPFFLSLTRPVVPTDTIGHWKLDDGSGETAVDSSVSGVNGTLTNMVPAEDWVAGLIDGGLDFDGSNDQVIIDNTGGEYTISTAVSISAWVKPTNLGSGWHGIAGRGGNYYLGWDGTRFAITYSTGSWVNRYGPSGKTNGQWYHVVGIIDWDNVVMELWVNNVQEVDSVTNGAPGASGSDLTIGQVQNQFGGGIMDDVRIYERVLTPAEIQYLYNMGN